MCSQSCRRVFTRTCVVQLGEGMKRFLVKKAVGFALIESVALPCSDAGRMCLHWRLHPPRGACAWCAPSLRPPPPYIPQNFMFAEVPQRPVVLTELFQSVFGEKNSARRPVATQADVVPVGNANAPDIEVPSGSLFG
jgi:hypothetical protein